MKEIEHLVLLMMENRSFDHYFGALNFAPELRTDVDGLGDNAWRTAPIRENPYLDALANEHGAWHWCLDTGGIKPRAAAPDRKGDGVTPSAAVKIDFPDPPHEYPACSIQCNGGMMDGFVKAYMQAHRYRIETQGAAAMLGVHAPDQFLDMPRKVARSVMGYYTGDTLPVYYDLADQFTICDRWHSSFLGSTHPNRVYANAGFCGDVRSTGVGGVFARKPAAVWDRWGQLGQTGGRAFDWRWYLPESEMLSTFLLWAGFIRSHDAQRRSLRAFLADCKGGTLPSVSIVEPPYSVADDHPSHDPRRGQRFVALLVNALRASPQWSSTALVVTYDEHGGFYDHVPPPNREVPGAPAPFNTLGVRVPAIVVSPYAREKYVSHRLYDHRSLLKSIAERWDLPLPDAPKDYDTFTDWSRIESIWGDCFDFSLPPRDPAKIKVTDVRADWLVQFDAEGKLPTQTDLVEAFVQMAHIQHLDGMRALMEEDYYEVRP